MNLHPTDRFVFCDLETFGLNYDKDPIIEIGFVIYDVNLSVVPIATFSSILWRPEYGQRRNKNFEHDAYVLDMHAKSGLWTDIQAGPPDDTNWNPLAVEERVLAWLSDNGIGRDDPLVGSSIQFDRNMLARQHPRIEEVFSYRNIDISSFKEMCLRINPDVYDKRPTGRKLHRVLDDIEDSRQELLFYDENFLYSTREI
jgi:oligoribonuclease